jgi:hypothetical protein
MLNSFRCVSGWASWRKANSEITLLLGTGVVEQWSDGVLRYLSIGGEGPFLAAGLSPLSSTPQQFITHNSNIPVLHHSAAYFP